MIKLLAATLEGIGNRYNDDLHRCTLLSRIRQAPESYALAGEVIVPILAVKGDSIASCGIYRSWWVQFQSYLNGVEDLQDESDCHSSNISLLLQKIPQGYDLGRSYILHFSYPSLYRMIWP